MMLGNSFGYMRPHIVFPLHSSSELRRKPFWKLQNRTLLRLHVQQKDVVSKRGFKRIRQKWILRKLNEEHKMLPAESRQNSNDHPLENNCRQRPSSALCSCRATQEIVKTQFGASVSLESARLVKMM
ncbi:hypothetical protein BLNAU_2993 [Blattamonas nauphoetae]|uniref:Uncharacterized protein n=1 Tax=Blattamonas nauphoetae TaxID=2049346 RepID=A0ABQ9YDV6_9EUKA|nr:hypothetical protein BLNAU_2993 [Blattamonas nauphoetae]